MNKVISSPKTYAIRNYLLKCVRELPPEPTRLMTEGVLCKKFGVNRETVRSAIHDLELSHVVARLPGRKGIFSNPAFSHCGIRIAGLCQRTSRRTIYSPFSKQFVFSTGVQNREFLSRHISIPDSIGGTGTGRCAD